MTGTIHRKQTKIRKTLTEPVGAAGVLADAADLAALASLRPASCCVGTAVGVGLD